MTSYGCVVVSRNDNYGGNLKERAAYAINSCIETYDEVVFVDYNSRDKTLIEEIESDLLKTGKLRCIIVDNSFHVEATKSFLNPQPCSEVLGRNIGISRLTTDFIVSTNVDEINPPRNYIESFTSTEDMVTVARHGLSLEHIKSLGKPIEINKIRDILLTQNFPQSFPIKMTPEDVWSLVAWCGDLQIAHRNLWYEIRGFEEWQLGIGYNDSYVQRKVIELGHKVIVSYDIPIWHIDHGKSNDYKDGGSLNDSLCLSYAFPGLKNTNDWGFPYENFKEFTI